MKTLFQAASLAMFVALGSGTQAGAATVAVNELIGSPINRDGIVVELSGIFFGIQQAGNYTLDFMGMGDPEGYLGFASVLSPADLATDFAGDPVSDGDSFDLGFLAAGVDFSALLLSFSDVAMSLNRVEDAPAPIPLPATLPLLAAGIVATGLAGRRRKA